MTKILVLLGSCIFFGDNFMCITFLLLVLLPFFGDGFCGKSDRLGRLGIRAGT